MVKQGSWKSQDWEEEEEEPDVSPKEQIAGQRAAKPSQARSLLSVKEEQAESAPRDDSERQAKIRALAERIRAENRKAQETATVQEQERKASEAVQTKQKEDEDMRRVLSILPTIETKVAAAEDEAEKVVILAAPLSMEAVEEMKDLQLSVIRDTERAAKAASLNVETIRRDLQRSRKEVEHMASAAKDHACSEIKGLEERLLKAKASLDEHKNVRKDYEASVAAQKLFGELSSRVAGVEIDAEKAAMMAEPLAKVLGLEEVSSIEIRETKAAIQLAQATLAPTARLISGKVDGLKGRLLQKMLELQTRAETAQALLDKAQQTVEEADSQASALQILKQVSERMASLEDVLEKMRETEAPFLMGIENLPVEQSEDALQKMDKASALAMSALADARKYVALKAVAANNLAEGAAASARQQLEKAGQQLDANIERVKKFQGETLRRRRFHLLSAVKERLDEAEAAIAKLQAASGDLKHARQTQSEDVAETVEKAHSAELDAQNSVMVARREFQERQQDLRALEGSKADVLKSNSEILRCKVKISQMEAELLKFRRLAESIEDRTRGQVKREVKEESHDDWSYQKRGQPYGSGQWANKRYKAGNW